MTRELTPDEQRAIRSLESLAAKWPKTLRLFSWSGHLMIMDASMELGEAAFVASIHGIPNDGGDP